MGDDASYSDGCSSATPSGSPEARLPSDKRVRRMIRIGTDTAVCVRVEAIVAYQLSLARRLGSAGWHGGASGEKLGVVGQ